MAYRRETICSNKFYLTICEMHVFSAGCVWPLFDVIPSRYSSPILSLPVVWLYNAVRLMRHSFSFGTFRGTVSAERQRLGELEQVWSSVLLVVR